MESFIDNIKYYNTDTIKLQAVDKFVFDELPPFASLGPGARVGTGRRSAVTAIQVIYAAPGSHLFSGRTQRICQANCQLLADSR